MTLLHQLILENLKNVAVGHPSVNSLRDKIEALEKILAVLSKVLSKLASQYDVMLLGDFNTLTAEGFQETGPFVHLSNHVFRNQ